MTKIDNDLAALWQSQSTQAVNLQKVQKQYNKETLKQRFYAFLDGISLLPLVYFWLFWEKEFSTYMETFMMIVTVGSVAFYGYLIWLRRIALQGRLKQTENYTDNLLKQLVNNQKIARFTRKSTWYIFVFTCMFLLGLYHFEPERSHIVPYLIGLYILISIALTKWASKREKRFISELEKAKQLLEE